MKWEYMLFDQRLDSLDAEKAFNKFGRDGWELIQITDFEVRARGVLPVAIFKRPLPASN